MGIIYNWILKVSFFAVLGSVILQMVPDHGFQKYVRFVLGLILAAMLIVPVMELFGKREVFENIYRNSAYKIQIRELEERSRKVQEDILGIEEQNIENQNTENQIQVPDTDRASDEKKDQSGRIEVERIEAGKESE